jgi:Sulfotransferase family
MVRKEAKMSTNLDSALNPDAIVEDAAATTGFDGWDDTEAREPLHVIVEALEAEADLSEVGRANAAQRLRNLLGQYFQMQRDSRDYPEILDVPIVAPIVMIGLPRSGTTLLHSLFSADPAHRGPQWWESLYPSPPPEAATYETDPRRARVQAELEAMMERSPDLASALPYAADWAAECNTLVQPSLRTMAFGAAFRVPSFDAWYLNTSPAPMYTYHRRALQQLSWRGPQGRWTLKAPPHMFTMEGLVNEYPDATLIQIHRDPLKTVPSNASLYHGNRIVNSDHADPKVAGRNILEMWGEASRRTREFRSQHPEIPVLDITYDELVADPIEKMRALYGLMGETMSADAEAAMRSWLVQNARDKRPAHRYELADFGLTAADVKDTFGEFEPRSSL